MNREKNRNIILIGMPGSGKSTLGVLLAKALGRRFVDTDLLIQEREGRLLQDIIDNDGIEKFLQIEEQVLLSVDVEHAVIATGGSAMVKAAYAGQFREYNLTSDLLLQLSQDMLAKGEHPRLENMMEKMAPELLRAARAMEGLRRRLGSAEAVAPSRIVRDGDPTQKLLHND